MIEKIIPSGDVAEHVAHACGSILFIARAFGLRPANNRSLLRDAGCAPRIILIFHRWNFSRSFERADTARVVRATPR